MQIPRLSTVLVEHAEEHVDTIRTAMADNHIDDVELPTIIEGALLIYRFAMVNDCNIQDVVAQLRTGPDSVRTKRTQAELRNSLQLLKGGMKERQPDCGPTDAA